MKLFDSHCHLQFPQYKDDLDAVLLRMQEQDMGAVVVGTGLESSKAGIELAEGHDFLWASVGLHPNDDPQELFDEAAFVELAQHPKVVAIGECGLDYYCSGKTGEERQVQFKRFEAQIQLALTLNRALIIHCRDSQQGITNATGAHEDMLTTLAAHRRDHGGKLRIVMHFFTGTVELAQKYLDLGCYLSYPGPITFTDMYDEAIKATPMDKMLIETDAPFAAPMPHRGKRNEPSYVIEVARKIAALKAVSEEEVGHIATDNAKRLFSLR